MLPCSQKSKKKTPPPKKNPKTQSTKKTAVILYEAPQDLSFKLGTNSLSRICFQFFNHTTQTVLKVSKQAPVLFIQ